MATIAEWCRADNCPVVICGGPHVMVEKECDPADGTPPRVYYVKLVTTDPREPAEVELFDLASQLNARFFSESMFMPDRGGFRVVARKARWILDLFAERDRLRADWAAVMPDITNMKAELVALRAEVERATAREAAMQRQLTQVRSDNFHSMQIEIEALRATQADLESELLEARKAQHDE